MDRVIYLDILLTVNLFINYFLLLTVKLLSKDPGRKRRLLLGAALGASFSFLIFFGSIHFLLLSLLKLLLSALIIRVAFRYNGIRFFIRQVGTLYIASFLLAGGMIFFWILVTPPSMIINNGVIYFDMSPIVVVLVSGGIYLLLSLITYAMAGRADKTEIMTLTVHMGENSAELRAFTDSGNRLCDRFTGAPVVVVYGEKIKSLFSPEMYTALTDPLLLGSVCNDPLHPMKGRTRIISYKTLSGDGILSAFRPDSIVLGNDERTIRNVLVAVSKHPLSEGEVEALIPSTLWSGGEDTGKKNRQKTKQLNIHSITKDKGEKGDACNII